MARTKPAGMSDFDWDTHRFGHPVSRGMTHGITMAYFPGQQVPFFYGGDADKSSGLYGNRLGSGDGRVRSIWNSQDLIRQVPAHETQSISGGHGAAARPMGGSGQSARSTGMSGGHGAGSQFRPSQQSRSMPGGGAVYGPPAMVQPPAPPVPAPPQKSSAREAWDNTFGTGNTHGDIYNTLHGFVALPGAVADIGKNIASGGYHALAGTYDELTGDYAGSAEHARAAQASGDKSLTTFKGVFGANPGGWLYNTVDAAGKYAGGDVDGARAEIGGVGHDLMVHPLTTAMTFLPAAKVGLLAKAAKLETAARAAQGAEALSLLDKANHLRYLANGGVVGKAANEVVGRVLENPTIGTAVYGAKTIARDAGRVADRVNNFGRPPKPIYGEPEVPALGASADAGASSVSGAGRNASPALPLPRGGGRTPVSWREGMRMGPEGEKLAPVGRRQDFQDRMAKTSDAAMRRFRKETSGKLYSGIDPAPAAALATAGGARIAQGASRVADLSEQVGRDVAARGRSYLDDVIDQARSQHDDFVASREWDRGEFGDGIEDYGSQPVGGGGGQGPGAVRIGASDSVFPVTDFYRNKYDYTKPGVVAPLPVKLETMATETPWAGKRATGINRAWKQEVDLVKKFGRGTRGYTDSEIQQILRGDHYTKLNMTGHHSNPVRNYGDWAGDPRNLFFLRQGRGGEHMRLGHPGGTSAPQNEVKDLVNRQWMLDNYGKGDYVDYQSLPYLLPPSTR